MGQRLGVLLLKKLMGNKNYQRTGNMQDSDIMPGHLITTAQTIHMWGCPSISRIGSL